jgi:hypothetical protein
MLSILGLIMGFLTLFVPTLLWPQTIPRLSTKDFVQQYPEKRWLSILHTGLPVFWVLLFAIAIFPILWRIGDRHLYLVSFTAVGGLSVAHGIIEIYTAVSMRNFSRGGPATFLVDDSVKRLGLVRLGLVLFLGLIPWGIANLAL